MAIQATDLVVIALGNGFGGWAAGTVLLSAGTAMVYPSLLAVIGDVAHPAWRGRAVGVYQVRRDLGYAVGAVLGGVIADLLSLHAAFDARAQDHDRWFDEHADLYRAELTAVAELLTPIPATSGTGAEGLEIGVGTGRFAAPLGISHGLEPAPRMAELARARGVDVVRGTAEELPFDTGRFAYTAFLHSLCFVTDADRALHEAHRVSAEDGAILVACLHRASPPGQELAARRAEDCDRRWRRSAKGLLAWLGLGQLQA